MLTTWKYFVEWNEADKWKTLCLCPSLEKAHIVVDYLCEHNWDARIKVSGKVVYTEIPKRDTW